MPLRSMLFTPGNQDRKVRKALAEIPADAVIVDLEDAVPIGAKEETRPLVAAALTLPRRSGARLYVRVNGVDTPWFFGDLDAVVRPGLDGIMLPKTAGAPAIYLVDKYLSHLEQTHGIPAGSIALMPLVESVEGLTNVREICRQGRQGTGRVTCLGFGAIDFTADSGAILTPGEEEILFVRTQLVLASRLEGLAPPIDTVYPHFRDPDGFERSSRRARDLGFQGRTCIHPDQIEPANRIFSPTEEEVAWAHEILDAFAEAEARGLAAIQVRGQLIDYAFLPRARRILEQAGSTTLSPLGRGQG